MHLKTKPKRRRFRPVIAAVLGVLIAAPLGAGPALAAEAPEIWQTDYKQALSEAAQENKRVLLEFAGSDWCQPCIQMDKDVLSQPDFKKFAASNLILVKLDFPRRKQLPPAEAEQNQKLQQKYTIEGFPTYVLLDPSGKEVRRQLGYLKGGPTEFIKWVRVGN
jgi:thioredoxin-related protein